MYHMQKGPDACKPEHSVLEEISVTSLQVNSLLQAPHQVDSDDHLQEAVW